MEREQLEHIIRAAGAVTNQYELVIIGSQSILGAVPNAPKELLQSMEADIFPLHKPELSDLIDGAIGEMSPFEIEFGYYAQGVGVETAILPEGWDSRLVKIQNENTGLIIGYCLEPHDLAASKLAAGREKDFNFVNILLTNHLVNADSLLQRIESLSVSRTLIERLQNWVRQHDVYT